MINVDLEKVVLKRFIKNGCTTKFDLWPYDNEIISKMQANKILSFEHLSPISTV